MALIDYFINSNDAEKPDFPDIAGILTHEVFEHPTTKRFIDGIKKKLGQKLRDTGSVPKTLDLSNCLGNVKTPKFSGSDIFKGLTFAIHILYGYSVVARNIVCDWEASRYKATVDIDLTDHFGLDYEDVVEFGTPEKVLNKLNILIPASLGAGLLLGAAGAFIYKAVTRSKLDSDTHEYAAGAGIGVSAGIAFTSGVYTALAPFAKQVAPGFRAWFILQHYRGCRPFLTVARKTIDIEGIIPK
ncbi:MAG: DUF3289 family protein [Spirochaetaceae bacterium]|nr:DUF3289 family protein [Spirochaetaceae bacterium]